MRGRAGTAGSPRARGARREAVGRDGGPEGVGGARGWLAEGRAERPGPAPFWAEKPAERVRLLEIRGWSFRRSCWRSVLLLSGCSGRYQQVPGELQGSRTSFCFFLPFLFVFAAKCVKIRYVG